MEIIQGEKFQNLVNDNIYYCHTHEVNSFFKNNKILDPFVLISHNSDGKILSNTENFPHANIKLAPPNLIKWFAQNIELEDERLISIPIGMENNYIKNAPQKITKILAKRIEEKKFKNLVYMNFNPSTNPYVRVPIWNRFYKKNFITVEDYNSTFDKYIDQVNNHAFTICPEGNGTDTHRTWESLYCNTIPIEKRNKNNIHFYDLPICFIDDWKEITEEFLLKEYERIISSKWNLQKLNFNYWKSLIIKTSKNL